jgi:zinc protease
VSGVARPTVGRPPAWRLPTREHLELAGGLGVTMVQVGAAPKATLQLVTGAGAALEGPGQTWLARLVARYLKEGTTHRDSAALADHVAGLGGELDVDSDEDTLWIEARVLSEYAPQAAELLAEVVRAPALPEDALPRLRADLGRQLELARSEPGWLTLARFREAIYGDHPYGRVLAHEAEIEGLSLAEARAFLDLGVGAAGSRLYVAGRFDAAAVGAAAERAFGDWAVPMGLEAPPPEPHSERVIHLVDRPGAAQSTIDLGLSVPGPTHDDFVPLMVADALLGGSFMSRITINIREQKGYTYSPRSTISAHRGDAYWLQTADVTTEVTGASLTEIFGEIERLRAEPPPLEELAGIQNYVAGVQLMRGATAPGLIGVLSFLELHGLDEAWAQSFVERVYAVTPGELQRVVVEHLRPEEMTIAVAGDTEQIEEQLAPFGRIERDER